MNRWHQHYLRGDYHNQDPRPSTSPAGHRPGGPGPHRGRGLPGLVHPRQRAQGVPGAPAHHRPPAGQGGGLLEHHHPVYLPVTSDPALAGKFRHHTFFFDKWSVGREGAGCYDHFPVDQHLYAQGIQACQAPNVFVAQVSEMDKHGYVHLSCDSS